MTGSMLITTNNVSTKVFTVAREPVRTMGIVLGLRDYSLFRRGAFSKTGHVFTCNNKDVNIYANRTIKICMSKAVVLKGW